MIEILRDSIKLFKNNVIKDIFVDEEYLKKQLENLQQENRDLKKENELLKELIKR